MNLFLSVQYRVIQSTLTSVLSITLVLISFILPNAVAMEHEVAADSQALQAVTPPGQASLPPQQAAMVPPSQTTISPDLALIALQQQTIGSPEWQNTVDQVVNPVVPDSDVDGPDVGSREWHNMVNAKVLRYVDSAPVATPAWNHQIHHSVINMLNQQRR